MLQFFLKIVNVCFSAFKTKPTFHPLSEQRRRSHISAAAVAIQGAFLWGFTEQNIKIVSLKFQLAAQ